MPYTMDDFRRDNAKKQFANLTPEELQEFLDSLPPEKRMAGLPPEKRMAGLPPEERVAGLPLAERLADTPAEEIREYLEKLTPRRPKTPRKNPKKK